MTRCEVEDTREDPRVETFEDLCVGTGSAMDTSSRCGE